MILENITYSNIYLLKEVVQLVSRVHESQSTYGAP